MLEYNGKEFRNLEDQVGYLTAAFNSGKLIDELGIKVLGVFPDLTTAKETIRPPYEYGDAFAIGTEAPYNLYIYTRDIEDFFDFGPFPAPGPKGDLGPAPEIQITAEATNTTGTPEVEVNKTGTDEAPVFNFKFKNIKGERGQTGMQGIQGPRGFQGPTGPIGPKGNTGPKGDVGPAFKLLGDLTSTSQLPTPTTALQSQGAAYTIPNEQGIKHIWVIQGTDNLLWTDIGVSGVQGPKGDPGDGINSLKTVKDIGAPSVTYNTTNGITISNTERYTYITAGSGAEVDVSTEKKIPLIAGEGISIDTTDTADKVVIKSLNTNIKNGTGVGSLVQTNVVSSSGTPYTNRADGSAAIALGKNCWSGGNTSFTIGQENNTGNYSGTGDSTSGSGGFTSGYKNQNEAHYTTVGGTGNIVTGNGADSIVHGLNNTVIKSNHSAVFGDTNHVDGGYNPATLANNNIVGGKNNNVGSSGNIVGGQNNLVNGNNNSLIVGSHNSIYTHASGDRIIGGHYNNPVANALVEIGNGTSNNDRKNAFVVLEDGTIRVPNFDSNGNRIGVVTLKVINGQLNITTYLQP